MYKAIYLCLVLAILAGCSLHENKFPAAKPEKVGMSAEHIDRIKPVMQRYVDEDKLPCMITMVARRGKVVHFEKYGWMDVDKPMQLNTVFRIASMTKPVTSVAVMMLYEEGCFQLDDPVADYIPEFRNLKVFSSIDKNGIYTVDPIRPMTIRDLLTHTSGFSGVGEDTPVDSMYSAANLSDGTLKDMIQKLSEIPLLYRSGTRWNYIRSTDVLGYLIEVISGSQTQATFPSRLNFSQAMEDSFRLPLII